MCMSCRTVFAIFWLLVAVCINVNTTWIIKYSAIFTLLYVNAVHLLVPLIFTCARILLKLWICVAFDGLTLLLLEIYSCSLWKLLFKLQWIVLKIYLILFLTYMRRLFKLISWIGNNVDIHEGIVGLKKFIVKYMITLVRESGIITILALLRSAKLQLCIQVRKFVISKCLYIIMIYFGLDA